MTMLSALLPTLGALGLVLGAAVWVLCR